MRMTSGSDIGVNGSESRPHSLAALCCAVWRIVVAVVPVFDSYHCWCVLLLIHIAGSSPTSLYHCDQVSHSHPSPISRNPHHQDYRIMGHHPCHVCGLSFRTNTMLRRHIQKHAPDHEVDSCKQCIPIRHLKWDHKERKPLTEICHVCQKECKNRTVLRSHMSSHRDVHDLNN